MFQILQFALLVFGHPAIKRTYSDISQTIRLPRLFEARDLNEALDMITPESFLALDFPDLEFNCKAKFTPSEYGIQFEMRCQRKLGENRQIKVCLKGDKYYSNIDFFDMDHVQGYERPFPECPSARSSLNFVENQLALMGVKKIRLSDASRYDLFNLIDADRSVDTLSFNLFIKGLPETYYTQRSYKRIDETFEQGLHELAKYIREDLSVGTLIDALGKSSISNYYNIDNSESIAVLEKYAPEMKFMNLCNQLYNLGKSNDKSSQDQLFILFDQVFSNRMKDGVTKDKFDLISAGTDDEDDFQEFQLEKIISV